jgi:uncharacterized membrane protein YoaK (UPF0700 family)
MDQDVSSKHVADLRVHHEETLSANLVLLWIHAMAGEWVRAFHYVPPLMAFVLGVVTASWLRHFAGASAGRISILVEIAFLFLVGILHNRFPAVAGTLGISFVAAMQTASFPRVEEWTYSSVMATSNLRKAIEGLFDAIAGPAPVCVRSGDPGCSRRSARPSAWALQRALTSPSKFRPGRWLSP